MGQNHFGLSEIKHPDGRKNLPTAFAIYVPRVRNVPKTTITLGPRFETKKSRGNIYSFNVALKRNPFKFLNMNHTKN